MGPENCIVGSVSPPGEEAYREDGGGGGVLGYGSDGGRWEEPNVLTWDTPLAAKGRERANWEKTKSNEWTCHQILTRSNCSLTML